MEKLRVGFALCGSYCTYSKAMAALERLSERYTVTPIFSEKAAVTDSRFGAAEDFLKSAEKLTGKPPIRSIVGAEPVGPRAELDVLVVAPCTGNTLGKLAGGVTDSAVTMAVKAQLRNERPVVLAVSTNDGLSGSAQNIGTLLNRRHFYFVPFGQDDPEKKPRSLCADFSRIEETIELAVQGKQLQPILLG